MKAVGYYKFVMLPDELKANHKIKVGASIPRYDCISYAGEYEGMDAFINGKGMFMLYLLESEKTIKVYPNPTNNFVTIQNEENVTENFEYKIVDLTSRVVKNGNSKFNEQINIESLKSGNYIIQIETETGEKISEKLVKN